MRLTKISCVALSTISGFLTCAIASAQMPVKHLQTPNRPIASAVWAGDTLYVSGQSPSPTTPADAAKGTAAVYGDTKAQTLNVLTRIEATLKEQGLTMGNVVMAHVYVVGDPGAGGKPDFAAMNAAWSQFFATKDQPNTPARSSMQVAALPAAGVLVEIEVIAVKSK